MVKGEYEKSLRISERPKTKQSEMTSYVHGKKQSTVKTPKSLTPQPGKKR